MDEQVQETWNALDLMYSIAGEVLQYVPRAGLGWIARQQHDGEWTDSYGIQIGKGVCFCTVEEARNADDAFIRQLAGQVLGYPVDSRQDLEARLAMAEHRIGEIETDMRSLQNEFTYWQDKRLKLVARLNLMD